MSMTLNMIHRSITISGNISFKRYNEESWSLEIEIRPDGVVPLLMEIALIEHDLAHLVTIQSKKSSKYVVLSTADNPSHVQYRDGRLHVSLSSNDMGLLAAYILQYYRDHCAPVDHIDIEVEHGGSLGKDAVLVIRTAHFAKPMSADEAKKLLGIDKERN